MESHESREGCPQQSGTRVQANRPVQFLEAPVFLDIETGSSIEPGLEHVSEAWKLRNERQLFEGFSAPTEVFLDGLNLDGGQWSMQAGHDAGRSQTLIQSEFPPPDSFLSEDLEWPAKSAVPQGIRQTVMAAMIAFLNGILLERNFRLDRRERPRGVQMPIVL